MVTIQLNNIEYAMPNSWSEVNYEMYNKLIDVFAVHNRPIYLMINAISVLANIPIEIINKVNVDMLKQIDLAWLSLPMSTELKDVITIDGVDYHLIKDLKKLTLGEYVDIEAASLSETGIHEIAAILMRPAGEEYNSDNNEERIEIFKQHLSIETLASLSTFFLDIASS